MTLQKLIKLAIEQNAEEFAPMFSGHGSGYRFDGKDPQEPTNPVSYEEARLACERWCGVADTIGGDAQIYHIPTKTKMRYFS